MRLIAVSVNGLHNVRASCQSSVNQIPLRRIRKMLSPTPFLRLCPLLFCLGQPNVLRARTQNVNTVDPLRLSSSANKTISKSSTKFIAPSIPSLSLDLINVPHAALRGNGNNMTTQLTAPLAICDRESPSPNADSCREAYNLLLWWLRSLPRQKVTAGTKGRIYK